MKSSFQGISLICVETTVWGEGVKLNTCLCSFALDAFQLFLSMERKKDKGRVIKTRPSSATLKFQRGNALYEILASNVTIHPMFNSFVKKWTPKSSFFLWLGLQDVEVCAWHCCSIPSLHRAAKNKQDIPC